MRKGDLPIVDSHHHLWGPKDMGGLAGSFLLDDLRANTSQVPAISGSVFIECGAHYRTDGPEYMKPVGEMEFAAGVADESDNSDGPPILGLIGHADLTISPEQLDEVLEAHDAASGGRFRGIRDALASPPPNTKLAVPGGAEPGRATNPDFRRGVAHLGDKGLTYDTWQYHTQLQELIDLARAVPQTTIVCDHLSTPLGVGQFEGHHDEVFGIWAPLFAELGRCENVVAKIGGLAQVDNGNFAPTNPGDPKRPDVDQYLAVTERWYLHAIESFGPQRCMFESNYPLDRMCVDYPVIWGAFRRIADRYDTNEQAHLLGETVRRAYRLPSEAAEAGTATSGAAADHG